MKLLFELGFVNYTAYFLHLNTSIAHANNSSLMCIVFLGSSIAIHTTSSLPEG